VSGFAFIARWAGPPPLEESLDPILATLRHRGGAGRFLHRGVMAVMGVHQRPMTPEDHGVAQPIRCSDPDTQLIFDGRIDNRPELLARLDLAPWTPMSDPELAARGFDCWGGGVMKRLIGPAVLAVIDQRRRRITICRDALGDRTAVYARIPGGLVVASEERALLAHPEVPPDLDEETVARFLAVRAPRPGRTFFAQIREVPAGSIAEIDGARVAISRHWRPEQIETDLRVSDAEWIDRFHSTLATAVRCRLRADAPPAVLMSGGLDSTSVAAHAATMLGAGHRLRTISWVFDELPLADERAFIQPMIDRFNLDATLITGDELWPMRDRGSWPCNPNMPLEGLYRPLTRAAYQAAEGKETRVLLNGEMGDHLFNNHDEWLRHLVLGGRFGDALRRIREIATRRGIRRSMEVLRPAAGRLVGYRRWCRTAPPWMNSMGASLIAPEDAATGGKPTVRVGNVVDRFSSFGLARETGTAAAMGIDVRRPYRDRRLIELALAMPAHLCSIGGYHKWILREAGRHLLPDSVRRRRHVSTLLPLCVRGLGDRGGATVRSLLADSAAVWRSHVRQEWVTNHLADDFPEDSIRSLAVWHCITLDLWHRGAVRTSSSSIPPSPTESPKIGYNFASENDYEKTA